VESLTERLKGLKFAASIADHRRVPKEGQRSMKTLGDRELSATHALQAQLAGTRVGHRWARMLRSHTVEIDALLAVHADLRHHVGTVVCSLSGPTGLPERLDGETVAMVTAVLDDLRRLGGFELQRSAALLSEEICMCQGRAVQEVLAG
jgi:hypothetical protein